MLTLLENPFDLTRDRTPLDHAPGESIGTVLEREGLDGRYQVACNGELLPPERALDFQPGPADDVHLVPVLENAALRTIALIGVMAASAYFTAGLGNFIGGVLFPSLSTAAQNAIAATVLSVGGSLLVQGVASLFQTKPGGNNYGVLGPQMTARSGLPIPRGYGRIARAPNLVESWIDVQGNNGDTHDVDDGADTIGRQYINARFDFGWGPMRSAYNLQLNGKDIRNYRDVAYAIIPGDGPQTPVTASDPRWIVLNRTTTGTTTNTEPTTDFTNTYNNEPVNQRVSCGIAQNFYIHYGTEDDTDQTTVIVVFPQGVWRYDDSMVIKRLLINYDVYVRAAGTSDAGWVLAQHHEYINIRQTILRQATYIVHPQPGKYDIKVVKNGSGAPFNPLDYFEHESNKFGDQLWVESVQEMTRTTLLYPRMMQVLLRIMATDQISGADLQLTMEIEHGLAVPLPPKLEDLPQDCHAACAYDALAEPVYGGGQSDDRIDLDFFLDWAGLTERQVDNGEGGTQRLASFNGVFDRDGENLWSAVNSIAVPGYANLQRIGKRVTGWLDADDVPVQMFHMGNIAQDSYSKTYLNLEDRAQQVEVTCAFASDQYKTNNPLRVVSADATNVVDRKKAPVNLRGCTDRVEAWYWASRRLQESEGVIRTHNFDSTVKAIRCRTGNVVKLQHDVPGYGWGGNLRAGSTAAVLVVDQPLQYVAGAVATVNYAALQVATAQIVAIEGNDLTVTGYDGTVRVARLLQAGLDVAITGYGDGFVEVEDATGLAGGTAALWDLDTMVERPVLAIAKNSVTLATPLPAPPLPDSCYFYEQPGTRVTKLVRIRQMRKRVAEQRVSLVAVDYIEPDVPAPEPGLVFTPTALPVFGPNSGGGTGSGGGSGGATNQAQFSVAYETGTHTVVRHAGSYTYDEDVDFYRVTGVVINAPGAGYLNTSTLVLSSGYVYVDPYNGTQTTDSDDPLTFTRDANGGFATVAGWSNKMWNALPGVAVNR